MSNTGNCVIKKISSSDRANESANNAGTSSAGLTVVRVRPITNEQIATGSGKGNNESVNVVAGPSASKQQQNVGVLKVISSEEYNQCSDDSSTDEEQLNIDDINLSADMLEEGNSDDDVSSIDDDSSSSVLTDGGAGSGSNSSSVQTNKNKRRISKTGYKQLGSKSLQSSKRSTKNSGKRRRVEKTGKGLRHFSMKVCEKVREKGTTSYNEVADELVEEFTNPSNTMYVGAQYDQKNIRRRVYDALNVLMAMNIISKERKEIRWIGLPTNSLQECLQLINRRKKYMENVKDKLKQLYELILHQICYKRLAEHNRKTEQSNGPLPESSRLHVPFVLVTTDKNTSIECHISQDKSEYLLNFDDKFEVQDDIELFKKMGVLSGLDKGQCSEQDVNTLKSLVPTSLQRFVDRLATGNLEFSVDEMNEFVQEYERTNVASTSAAANSSEIQEQLQLSSNDDNLSSDTVE